MNGFLERDDVGGERLERADQRGLALLPGPEAPPRLSSGLDAAPDSRRRTPLPAP